MVCLVELPESVGANLSKASSYLSKRAPSVPSSMKRELAGLGGGPTGAMDVKAKTIEKNTIPGSLAYKNKRELEEEYQGLMYNLRYMLGYGNQGPGPQDFGLEYPDDDKAWNRFKSEMLIPRLNALKENKATIYDSDDNRSRVSTNKEEKNKEIRDRVISELPKILKRRDQIKDAYLSAPSASDQFYTTETGSVGTRYAKGDARDFDSDLSSKNLRRSGEKTYDKWSDSYGSGASKVGEGSFGSVIRNEDGTYIKRGAISDTEAELINRLGKADLGPRLIAADINGKHDWHDEDFVDIRNGRIAMTGVPGKPIGETAFPDTKLGGRNAADVYWSAMGNLHRTGIAHNDAHIDNILVDDKGKGRWVDLGLAQANPKAAFLEAFGTFTPANKSGGSNWKEGNWQTSRWRATGVEEYFKRNDFGRGKEFLEDGKYKELRTVIENQPKVLNKLRSMGFTVSEIDKLIKTPIRSTPETFQQGPWAKMTDAQAMELIKTFYDGI
jgi:hypothetical protein